MRKGCEKVAELIGVAEIAERLGVSRQRADQLTRTKDFPAPIDRIVVTDDLSVDLLHELLRPGTHDRQWALNRVIEEWEKGQYRMPEQYPRLWRSGQVDAWAESVGRQ